VHGSGALIRWLLDNSLVDQMNLLIVPVVLGQGTRLFPTPARTLRLTWSLASRLEGRNDPGLSAHRAAVCNRHRRPRRRMTPAPASGDIPEHWPTAVLRSICARGGRSTHRRMSLRGGPLQRSR
jgi:RibD domain-containing protein